MLEVERFKNSHGYDVFNIITDDGIFEISYQNNFDLYWRYICDKSILDSPSIHEFKITKENYFIYQLFDKLYNSIKNGIISYDGVEHVKVKQDLYNPYRLFKDDVVDWHSDDFYYDNASRVIIKKENDDEYKVIFEKSKKEYDDGMFMTYSVRFRNSGSRYDPFNIVFMSMYNELKTYDPNYHQIDFEEIIYKQKTLKM